MRFDVDNFSETQIPGPLTVEGSQGGDDLLSLVSGISEHPTYGGICRAIAQRCTNDTEAYVGFPAFRSQVNDGIFCMTKEGFCVMEVHGDSNLRLRDLTPDDLQSLDAETIHSMAREARARVMSGLLGRARRSFH
jgi:hypothetical protein